MKTSTKLTLIYGGLIVAGILTIYITTHFIKEDYQPWKNFVHNTVELSDYRVIQFQDSLEYQVIFNDTSRIMWYQPKESVQKALSIQVRNDTLFVAQNSGSLPADIRLMVKQPASIVVKSKAIVSLVEPKQKELDIKADNGTCTLVELKDAEKIKHQIENLQLTIDARNHSNIKLNSYIKDLTATLDSSEMYVSNVKDRMTLTEKNRSSTNIFLNPLQLMVQRDSTSSF